jgi:hypothetical protein
MRYFTSVYDIGLERKPRALMQEQLKAAAGPRATEVLATYEKLYPDWGDVAVQIASDAFLRLPSIRLAEAVTGFQPVYMYLFSYRSTSSYKRFGSMHSIEIPFVFGTVDLPEVIAYLGRSPHRAELSARTMDHWVAFARQGNPALPGGLQWPLYDAQSRQTMELGPASRLVSDPLGEQRRAWGEQLPSKDSAWQLLQKNHSRPARDTQGKWMSEPDDALLFPGFRSHRVAVSAGVWIDALVGGSGPALLLLHGHPQTRAMWHKLAPALVLSHTLVMPDLRGYGSSSKPAGLPDHANYAKREMALDQITLMRSLGFSTFDVLAHDRGARVAHRLAMDHPAAVGRMVNWPVASAADLPQRQAWLSVLFRLDLGLLPRPFQLGLGNQGEWLVERRYELPVPAVGMTLESRHGR